ncbi:DUF2316 family protein [Candidatus Enterococcus clewellii]|uniref:DUF2316 family protein n=1 Tax=Candidatus Enterococcus clewellii TaxID=1834193 RepID=A0A242K4T2_9ENTE|nr:DUF2316 family protein [Enterococcus sp. 9E7_DIV0242]OTP14455.1 hypothetical protein A5888_002556 [Enterococcus sp. 9E7_DIV0242]
MTLTVKQQENTIEEFKQNIALTGRSIEQIARDLHTDAETIRQVQQLNAQSLEEPWVLRNYLLQTLEQMGKTPVAFSALVGDHHQYWFLNAAKIDQKKIG